MSCTSRLVALVRLTRELRRQLTPPSLLMLPSPTGSNARGARGQQSDAQCVSSNSRGGGERSGVGAVVRTAAPNKEEQASRRGEGRKRQGHTVYRLRPTVRSPHFFSPPPPLPPSSLSVLPPAPPLMTALQEPSWSHVLPASLRR